MKNNYTSIFVGFLHFVFTIILSLYGFIFNKSWFDDVYILYFMSLLISWTLFNGECVVSYIYNLYRNPNHKAGEDLISYDVLNFIGNKTGYFIFTTFILTLKGATFYIVLSRNSYPTYIVYLSVLLYLLYIFLAKMVQLYSINSVFLIVNEIVKYVFLLLFFYFIYETYKKYKK